MFTNRASALGLQASFGRALWTGVLVFALTLASLMARREVGHFAAIWPANAVVVAILLRTRKPWWFSILVAGLVGNLAAKFVIGNHMAPTLVLPIGNSLEIFVSAALTHWIAGDDVDLSKPRHLAAFTLSAGLVAPALTASAASVLLSWLQGDPLSENFFSWWSTDALGLLIVTPALLALTPEGVGELAKDLRRGRGALSVGALTCGLALAFGQHEFPLVFLIPAALIFVAFELDVAGAALALLITATFATIATMLGAQVAGLSSNNFEHSVVVLQAFLATMSLLVLPVAAALASRARLEEKLRAKQSETEAALRKLSESEARYRLLTDRTLDVILRYDLNGVIEYISPSVSQYGYQPEELVGRSMVELAHADDASDIAGRTRQLATGEALKTGSANVFRARRADGEWIWLEGNPAPMRNAADEVIGAVSVLRDVTQRRALEAALQRRTIEAEAASVAKSEFLANMSHEIRTPLTGILGFAGLLRGSVGLPALAATYVERIAVAGETLLAVVNDILDFSKLEAGQLELDPHAFELSAFIDETIDLVSQQAGQKGLKIVTRSNGTLPSAVFADSSRLRQILLNLLTNAIKFTEHGQVTIAVDYLTDGQGTLRVEVSDTGVGIASDKLGRLFERFSQVDGSITRAHGGTGLGLAISKTLTALMGGEIGVETVERQGAKFWFTIAAPIAEAPKVEATTAPFYATDPARILVVDDVAANRHLVLAMLSPFGHHMSEASSGAEAVAMAMRAPVNLILMDLQMPGMDGLAATRAIRGGEGPNANVPIVALSANVLPTHLEACKAAGMNDHIAKPIVPAELLLKVHMWTGGSLETLGAEEATASARQ